MLSVHLADQQSIEDFIRDKSDREIAVVGLTLIDQHVKECAQRWDTVARALKYLGTGMTLVIAERVATDVHWEGLSKIIETMLGAS